MANEAGENGEGSGNAHKCKGEWETGIEREGSGSKGCEQGSPFSLLTP